MSFDVSNTLMLLVQIAHTVLNFEHFLIICHPDNWVHIAVIFPFENVEGRCCMVTGHRFQMQFASSFELIEILLALILLFCSHFLASCIPLSQGKNSHIVPFSMLTSIFVLTSTRFRNHRHCLQRPLNDAISFGIGDPFDNPPILLHYLILLLVVIKMHV